jgi:hypothetical protein
VNVYLPPGQPSFVGRRPLYPQGRNRAGNGQGGAGRIYANLRAASGDLVIFSVSGLQREMGTIQIHLPLLAGLLLATWQSTDPKKPVL